MLKQIVLYSTAFAATAFAPTQRLVGRAFGASSTGYKHAGRFVAMPTLAVQSAATPRSGAEELCKKLSSTVAGTLGKPESYVMVTFQKVDAMYYAVRKSTSELGYAIGLPQLRGQRLVGCLKFDFYTGAMVARRTRPLSCTLVPSARSTRTRTKPRAPRSRTSSRPSSACPRAATTSISSIVNGAIWATTAARSRLAAVRH